MAQRFHILGIGSIGQLLAHSLRSAGQAVTLLARSASKVESFTAAGQTLSLEHGPGNFCSTNAGMELAQASTHKDIRNLVVSTKGNDVVPAVRSVQDRLQADSSIILIQNGILGVHKALWREVLSTWDASSRPRVIVGSLTHGAYLKGPFHVFHASPGSGTCTFAEVDAGLPSLTDARHQHMWAQSKDQEREPLRTMLSLKPLQPEQAASHQALLRILQLKLACNCAINPLTAIFGCPNGDLLLHPSTKEAMQAVCTEVHGVFGSAACASAEEMFETVCRVAAGTAGNRSSMLQDIAAGRPTELPFLNGYVVQQGLESQVPTPANTLLCQLVSFQEGRGEFERK